jgi:HK97 family phage major capsid protein
VPGGTTTQTDWAAALVDTTNLASEFVEWLRPQTIIGKFGTGGIPALRTVPFNIRVVGQQSGGTGYWVGEGAPKPLTSFKFGASTLGYTKVAAIAVITEELARFSSPSAENLVRDALRDALVERIDSDFLDPGVSAIAGVRPASLTNGLTALSSAGTSADNVRTDLGVLLSEYVENNQNPSGIVLVMPNTLALGLSLVVNALGQREFPGIDMNGGNLNGIPTITSQYVADASGRGNMVVAINAREVFLADDGQVTVDASREASLQMLDNPTNSAASGNPTTMVSMFQTDSIALRAERFINWAKRRTDAVVYMDDVNWGAVGSP